MPEREPLFLDASVVMYAAGAPHRLRESCRRALRHVVETDLPLVSDSEVLQEILYRYFSIRRPGDAEKVFAATRDLCMEIFPVEEDDAARALELLLQMNGLDPRDAVHVAVMEHNEVEAILSADTDFDALPTVHRVDPTSWPGP